MRLIQHQIIDELKIDEIEQLTRLLLQTGTLCLFDRLPTQEEKDKWSTMNEEQLRLDLRKMQSEGYSKYRFRSNVWDKIKEMKLEHKKVLFWTTIFQIFGLLVNQIGIILGLI